MNNITVAGQLGKDAELRTTPNGDPVLNFSIADSQGQEKPTLWWNCQIWGKRATSLAPHMLKAQSVTITGSVTEREYTDKDGNKRKSMDIRVNDVALQGGRKEESAPPQRTQSQPQRTAPAKRPASGFDDMDDDIPF